MESNIILVSSEGDVFVVPINIAALFRRIYYRIFIGDPILLPDISTAELAKAIEFGRKHILQPQFDIPDDNSCNRTIFFMQWVTQMLDPMTDIELVNLYYAAKYLRFSILQNVILVEATDNRGAIPEIFHM